MTEFSTLTSGFIGAAALNLTHETGRKLIANAPHVDLLAMRALGIYVLKPLNQEISLPRLRRITMIGDLISNSLYYAITLKASKNQEARSVWKRAWTSGLIAGSIVAFAPPFTRLGPQPSRNRPLTALLTIAWYTIGSLAAASAYRAFQSSGDSLKK